MAESAFNIGDIQGQIKGLSDQIVPVDITSSLSFLTGVSKVVGGVYRIGSVIFIQIRLATTVAINSNKDIIYDLPLAKGAETTYPLPLVTNLPNQYFYLRYNGGIRLTGTSTGFEAGSEFSISGCYVAAS